MVGMKFSNYQNALLCNIKKLFRKPSVVPKILKEIFLGKIQLTIKLCTLKIVGKRDSLSPNMFQFDPQKN